jgi:bacillithiol biosynthesis cysteine-adding enzyme BshC
MRLEPRPLSGTPLATAWLSGSPSARSLFARDPAAIESYEAKAREVDARVGKEERTLAASCLFGGGPDAKSRIARFVNEQGFVVTTGQQPALFGGPLYGLYKGLSAAALARRLEEALGRPVLPVFWIASEDHDWDEARSTYVIDVGNEVREVSLPPREEHLARPLSQIPAGATIGKVLEEFSSLLPDTEFASQWLGLLASSYGPDKTLADSYAVVLEALLGRWGIFLVQSHHPDLKARALPMLLRELTESRARERALEESAADIRAAGFDLQVPLLPDATNVFVQGDERRERVFRDGEGFRLRGSERRVDFAELEAMGREDPGRLSPNVLLRPVVESLLFPTLSYVAGPGETSYLPQTRPVFDGHGLEMPVIHPRLSVCVVESKIEKVLRKFELVIDDLDVVPEELAGRLAKERIPDSVQSSLDLLRTTLNAESDGLLEGVAEIDPTLSGPVQTFQNQSLSLVDDIERKVVQSLKRRSEITLNQVAKAQLHLFPLGQPQERVLNPFYYLTRYDEAFLAAAWSHALDAVLP